MSWRQVLDDLVGDEPTLLEMIEIIRTVTEGKIFVELERARVTKVSSWHQLRFSFFTQVINVMMILCAVQRLADIKEANGDIASACTTLNDIQVITAYTLSAWHGAAPAAANLTRFRTPRG